MPDPVETIEVAADDDGIRLDRWFRQNYPHITHGYLQKLLRSGQIRIDARRCKAADRLTVGSRIRVPKVVRSLADSPAAQRRKASETSLADQEFIESLILYEDDYVLVLNKPFGLAVQGGTGTKRHLDGLLAGMTQRFAERPRLVHRLDRDTTGVLLVAKTRGTAGKLGKLFQSRSAAKTYWAVVKGVPKPPQGKIKVPLVKATGRDGDRVRKAGPGEQAQAMHATTHYAVIDRLASKAAWVSLKPVTGRQHQLRAHMAIIGHPIMADNKYNTSVDQLSENIEDKLHLHARRLVLPHPWGEEKIDVTAPLPEHMRNTFERLGFDAARYEHREAP